MWVHKDLPEAIEISKKILTRMLGLLPGASVLFLADSTTDLNVIQAFSSASESLGAEVFTFFKKPHEKLLSEFPRPLAELVKYVDVYFNFCHHPHGVHTLSSRVARQEYGTRYIAAPRINMEALLSPALQVDPDTLMHYGEGLREKLIEGKVKITSKNGTNFTCDFQKEATATLQEYGVADDYGMFAALPAGSQHLHQVPGTVNGDIVFDRIHYHGFVKPLVRFSLQNDRVVNVTGGPDGLAKELFEKIKSIENADYMGEMGFGVNPYIKPGWQWQSKLFYSRMCGAMHIGFGESREYGGTVRSSTLDVHGLISPKIEVGNKVIVENNEIFID